MIDMHTHILPSIDDGSRNIVETMQMIKEAELAGFTDIITTSHYIENEYDVPKSSRKWIIEAIESELAKQEIEVKLYNGAEAFVTNILVDLYDSKIIPTLAESRYVLFEIPMHSNVLYLDQVIEDLITAKYKPIIAHPERYDVVQEDPNLAIKWVKNGVLLQSNYGSIVERYGHKAKQTLLKLLEANAIHFLGTDTHAPGSNYIRMREMLDEYEKVIGKERLEELTTINPRKIIDNEHVDVEIPEEIKKRWFNK